MKHYPIHAKVDRAITYDHREMLYFSGTSYLGMGNLAEFEDHIIQGIKIYGSSHGSSRGSNLQLQVYDDFERFFASKAGTERGLLFSSGFLAGSAAVKVLSATADMIFTAPDAHPAILPDHAYDASLTFEQWARQCHETALTVEGLHITLLSNAVDPLIPSVHDFSWVNDLPNTNTYTLLIDDSHAFGIVGDDIFGTYKKWSKLKAEVIVCGSLGKALGIPGGIVLGDSHWIGRLEQETIFRSASPPAPAFYHAFLQSQPLYELQKAKLAHKVQLFSELTAGLAFLKSYKGYPVFAFDDETLVYKLEKDNIIISSFPYPELSDPCINRIVLSAYHQKEDLERLANCLKQY